MRAILNMFIPYVNDLVNDIKYCSLTSLLFPYDLLKKSGWTFDKTLFETTLSMYQTVSPQPHRQLFLSQDSHECVWFCSSLSCICAAPDAVGCSNQAEHESW